MSLVLEREKARVVSPSLPREVIARIRAQLSEAVRKFWSTPEGQQLRMALSAVAQDYADVLKAEAERLGLSEVYKRAAETVGLSYRYKAVWGKA